MSKSSFILPVRQAKQRDYNYQKSVLSAATGYAGFDACVGEGLGTCSGEFCIWAPSWCAHNNTQPGV